MLKKPMTTEEFFDKMCEILKEKGMMPDILDYALATSEPVPMKTYEYSIRNNLDYGGSEAPIWISGLSIMTRTEIGKEKASERLRR